MTPLTGRAEVGEDLKSIIICVDSYDDSLLKGYIYHGTLSAGKKFNNLMQLILAIEDVLENTGFPKATTDRRVFGSFNQPGPKEKVTDEKFDLTTKTGELASFRLRIIFRQNASWQGSLAWLENSIEEPFRSALEMIMLIDSALSDLKMH